MARRRARDRGEIEELSSGSLRVTVYAGVDPLTKRRHRIREVIAAGPTAAAEAEKALRRLLVQVDEQRSPTTAATVEQLLDRHFELLEVEPSTLATYRSLATTHIVPLLGKQKVGALRAAVFDSSTPSYGDAERTATAVPTPSIGPTGHTSAMTAAGRTPAVRSRSRRSGRFTSPRRSRRSRSRPRRVHVLPGR